MSFPRTHGSQSVSGVSSVSNSWQKPMKSSFSKPMNMNSEPQVLSKKCAIVFPNEDSITIDKYLVAVGQIVGFKNIVFGGKAGPRVIMHLISEELADTFTEENDHVVIESVNVPVKKLVTPGVKIIFNQVNPCITNERLHIEISKFARPITPVTYVHSGLRDARLSHIFSYRREVLVQEKDNIPPSINVYADSEVNVIFLTVDNKKKCYSCGQEGHTMKVCPTKMKTPAQDRFHNKKDKERKVITQQSNDSYESSSREEPPDILDSSIFPAFKSPSPHFEDSESTEVSPTPQTETNSSPPPSALPPPVDLMLVDEQEERKPTKRTNEGENIEKLEKKVKKVEEEFQEDFLSILDTSIINTNSSIQKTDILKLLRESKGSRNKLEIISQLGFNHEDLGELFSDLLNNKISQNLKKRIKDLARLIHDSNSEKSESGEKSDLDL